MKLTELEESFPHVEQETGRRFASQNLTNYNKDTTQLELRLERASTVTWLFSIGKDAANWMLTGRIVYSAKSGYPTTQAVCLMSHRKATSGTFGLTYLP